EAAARAMAKIGPSAARMLIDALKSGRSNDRLFALQALDRLRESAKAAIPLLLDLAAKATDPGERQRALDTLEGIDANGEALQRALARALKDENRELRLHAVMLAAPERVRGSRPRPPQAPKVYVSVLLDALKDKDPEVRRSTAQALLNADFESVAPTLGALLQDKDTDIRRAVAGHLHRLRLSQVKDMLPALIT